MSGLDDLDAQADSRRRTRKPPSSRNPHVPPSALPALELSALTVEAVAKALPAPHEPASSAASLSFDERAEFDRCEAALRAADAAFWVRGRMLQTIRDAGLFRETYGTFEDYCLQVWGRTSRRVNQLIEAWPLAERLLLDSGTIVPKINEGQMRALAPLAAEHGQDAAVYLYRALSRADVQVTAGVITSVIRLLPAGSSTETEFDRAVGKYLAGPRILPAPRGEQTDPWSTAFAQITRSVERLATVAGDDPDRARAVADRLEEAAAQIRARLAGD